jgi:hypothetical protein
MIVAKNIPLRQREKKMKIDKREKKDVQVKLENCPFLHPPLEPRDNIAEKGKIIS